MNSAKQENSDKLDYFKLKKGRNILFSFIILQVFVNSLNFNFSN